MLSVKIFLILLVCLFFHIIWKRRKFYLLTLKIPGPLGYPVIGMAHKLRRREEILTNLNLYERIYGNFLFSWLGPLPVLVVVEPQIAQDILTSPYCVNKGIMYSAVRDMAGDGLFVLKQPEWSRHRKSMNPAFNHKILLNYFPIFNEETDKLVELFGEHCGRGEIRVIKLLQNFILSLSTITTMGFHLSQEKENDYTILTESIEYCLETATHMIFSPWLKSPVFRMIFGQHWKYENSKQQTRSFIRTLIDKRILHNRIPYENKTLVDLLLNLLGKGNFTNKNMEDESVTTFFGAFETTSNTIANTLMLLAMFPEYQQKLFEEILNFFPDQKKFLVTIQDLQEMVYLDMVINEVLRLMSAVPLIAREVSNDVTLSNGVTLPKGLQIAIDIFNMHRRTDIWGLEAHIFNPDNFLPTNLENKHSYAYIPFAKGLRNCIGWRYALLSIKIVIIKLIRNYNFKSSFKFEDLVFVEGITLKLKETPLLEINRNQK